MAVTVPMVADISERIEHVVLGRRVRERGPHLGPGLNFTEPCQVRHGLSAAVLLEAAAQNGQGELCPLILGFWGTF